MTDRSMTCDAAVAGGERCDRPAICQRQCPHCEVLVGICSDEHEEGALTSLSGHLLLVHPDRVPELVAEVAHDPYRRAIVAREAERNPRFALLAAAVQAVAASVH